MSTEKPREVVITNAQASKAWEWLKQYALDNPKQVEASHAVLAWAAAVKEANQAKTYKMLLNELPRKT